MISNLKHIGTLVPAKPTILFIPGGMGTSPSVFDGIGDKISWQSAQIDWSRSAGPWDILELGNRVTAFIEEQKLESVILAGYSAGGVIALQAAIADTNKHIKGLLLSNTGPCAIGHGDPHLPDKVQNEWFSMELYEPFLKRCFAFEINDKLKQELIDYAKTIDKDVVYQSTKTLRQHDLRPHLKDITCPVVIVHGILDQTRTSKHVDMLIEGIAETEVYYLHGGHTIMVEDSEGYLHGLKRLIAKVEMEGF